VAQGARRKPSKQGRKPSKAQAMAQDVAQAKQDGARRRKTGTKKARHLRRAFDLNGIRLAHKSRDDGEQNPKKSETKKRERSDEI